MAHNLEQVQKICKGTEEYQKLLSIITKFSVILWMAPVKHGIELYMRGLIEKAFLDEGTALLR